MTNKREIFGKNWHRLFIQPEGYHVRILSQDSVKRMWINANEQLAWMNTYSLDAFGLCVHVLYRKLHSIILSHVMNDKDRINAVIEISCSFALLVFARLIWIRVKRPFHARFFTLSSLSTKENSIIRCNVNVTWLSFHSDKYIFSGNWLSLLEASISVDSLTNP